MNMNRRSFLRGLGAVAVAAPAIVRIENLMPVQSLWPTDDWGILQRCLDLGLPVPTREYRISKPLLLRRNGVFDLCYASIRAVADARGVLPDFVFTVPRPLSETMICNARIWSNSLMRIGPT
jgi:hypothetical protein